jgi:3-(3-hydroxy-phenyl)propionate hydroxylase
VPPPGPGVLLPDVAVSRSGRLRAVARDGFLLLTAPGADLDAVHAAAASALGPVQVLAMADADPSGGLVSALGARRGETWLIRPDAYVAAVTPELAAGRISAALRRALGR